jgi:hypothetical protein
MTGQGSKPCLVFFLPQIFRTDNRCLMTLKELKEARSTLQDQLDQLRRSL